MGKKKLLSFLLALVLSVTMLPINVFGAEADFVGRGSAEVKTVGASLYDYDEGLTLQKVDPSNLDLTNLRKLPTEGVDIRSFESSSIAVDFDFTEEETTYVAEYAEMLTDQVGMVDLFGLDNEVKYVFVWLQDLPEALERVYQQRGMRNRNYERARENGRKARNEIKGRHSRSITWEYSVVFSGF
ncbi:MAG: hypothetical protein FWF03_06425, partial [Defluviitaleaceae bacterium]|nr:hypothetical protein [Defluviitaleaceae bacterium]